ncbi:hypothetical protein CAP35_00115 [Chitinophagaceae bacterium IBVUCB1]|nr:hypothetical protein CAP35_00115 [Chitinophagaceae bacterium IBVUCB1]
MGMKKIISGLVLISSCLSGVYAQDNRAKTIDSVLAVYNKQGMFNGAVLVTQYGRPLFAKGYGYRDVAKKIANDTNTVFQIGSITKTYTATMVLMLQEQGKLNVKDKLAKYMPDYPDGEKITIENLLTHTSGIYNYTEDTTFANKGLFTTKSRKEMLAVFKDKLTGIEPGTTFNYSNSNYILLGYIIEDITGKPYYTALREMMLQPLGMHNTGSNFAGLKNKYKATGYFSIDDNNGIKAPLVDSSVSYAAGCIYTTVGDLMKWADAVQRAKLLRKESWIAATTEYKQHYGYGWMIGESLSKKSIGHNGGVHGFVSNMFMTPDDAHTVILLSNVMDNDLAPIRRNITAIVNNKPFELPEFRNEIKLPAALLKDYAGKYELAPNFYIDITLEGDKLFAQATGQTKLRMYAERKDFFFLKLVDAQFSFARDAAGKVEKLNLRQGGRILPGIKK